MNEQIIIQSAFTERESYPHYKSVFLSVKKEKNTFPDMSQPCPDVVLSWYQDGDCTLLQDLDTRKIGHNWSSIRKNSKQMAITAAKKELHNHMTTKEGAWASLPDVLKRFFSANHIWSTFNKKIQSSFPVYWRLSSTSAIIAQKHGSDLHHHQGHQTLLGGTADGDIKSVDL